MIQAKKAKELIRGVDALLSKSSSTAEKKIHDTMQLLQNEMHWHWVGVYVLKENGLELGPYVGPETDHRFIPIGRGVCGTAVAEEKNQIVDDVRAVGNYLACNLETRAEIVVLIRDSVTRQILGQIDVDGTEIAMFDSSDEEFLEQIARKLEHLIKTIR